MIRRCIGIGRNQPQLANDDDSGRRAFHWHGVTIACAISALCLGMLTGCPADEPARPSESVLPFEGIALKVTVVDDPSIAAGILRIENEWKAVTGSQVAVSQESLAEVSAGAPAGDVWILSPQLLGKLADADALAEIPAAALEPPTYQWRQVFELLQSHETRWAGKTVALPLGSPVFTLIYRQDLLNQVGQKPPSTWDDYQKLSELLVSEFSLPSIEPITDGWSGKLLLARAACYAKHADNFSALFRTDTMEPLIAGPPFERALSELVAAAKHQADAKLHDPAAAREELLAGRAAMAITWASAGGEMKSKMTRTEGTEFGFVELPGSPDVFDHRRAVWDRRKSGEAVHVPLIAPSGRLACVSRKCEFREPAIELIRWLSGPKWSADVASRSPATTLFRDSHLKDAKQWCDPDFSQAEAQAYGETVRRSLERPNFLAALRIPAAEEYMAALDRAVAGALAGEQSPQAALEKAAETWQKITDRVGRDAQRRAYQHSNGMGQ